MTYQRPDEIETEITLDGVDVSVIIMYTATMYDDGSGASSVVIENIINIETDRDIIGLIKADDRKNLADWIRSKQG